MTQQAVERVLGKLITDEAFRDRFFETPGAACWEAGLALSAIELEALGRLSRDELVRFGDGIDERICRPCLDRTWREVTEPRNGANAEEDV